MITFINRLFEFLGIVTPMILIGAVLLWISTARKPESEAPDGIEPQRDFEDAKNVVAHLRGSDPE